MIHCNASVSAASFDDQNVLPQLLITYRSAGHGPTHPIQLIPTLSHSLNRSSPQAKDISDPLEDRGEFIKSATLGIETLL